MKISASVLEQFKVGEKNFWIASIAFVVLLFLIFVVFPWWHERYFGVAADESAAVGALRWVNTLENQYAAAHAAKGFACEFRLLQATEQMSGAAARHPAEALSAKSHGYNFSFIGCAADAHGIVTHYQVAAVPMKPAVTGLRTFCTDQTGALFYDDEASASQCFASRETVSERLRYK
jgi:hypothetical protein